MHNKHLTLLIITCLIVIIGPLYTLSRVYWIFNLHLINCSPRHQSHGWTITRQISTYSKGSKRANVSDRLFAHLSSGRKRIPGLPGGIFQNNWNTLDQKKRLTIGWGRKQVNCPTFALNSTSSVKLVQNGTRRILQTMAQIPTTSNFDLHPCTIWPYRKY